MNSRACCQLTSSYLHMQLSTTSLLTYHSHTEIPRFCHKPPSFSASTRFDDRSSRSALVRLSAFLVSHQPLPCTTYPFSEGFDRAWSNFELTATFAARGPQTTWRKTFRCIGTSAFYCTHRPIFDSAHRLRHSFRVIMVRTRR